MKLWEVKIGMIVVHNDRAMVGVVTGIKRRNPRGNELSRKWDIETDVMVQWDENLKESSHVVIADNLQQINPGRYAWVLRERKRKAEEND